MISSIDNTRAARLHSLVPEDTLFIAESGIQKREDMPSKSSFAAGIRNFPIGEAMMKAEDKAENLLSSSGKSHGSSARSAGFQGKGISIS